MGSTARTPTPNPAPQGGGKFETDTPLSNTFRAQHFQSTTTSPKSIRPACSGAILRLMHLHRPILTAHRLQRLVLWMLAMLSWCATALLGERGVGRRHARQRGDISLRVALRARHRTLIMIRARHSHPARTPQPSRAILDAAGATQRPSHFRRSLLRLAPAPHAEAQGPAPHTIAQLAKLLAQSRQLRRASRPLHAWPPPPSLPPSAANRGRRAASCNARARADIRRQFVALSDIR